MLPSVLPTGVFYFCIAYLLVTSLLLKLSIALQLVLVSSRILHILFLLLLPLSEFSCGETGTTFTPVNGDEAESVSSRELVTSALSLSEVMHLLFVLDTFLFVIISFDLRAVLDERDSESASMLRGTLTYFVYVQSVFIQHYYVYNEFSKLFVRGNSIFSDSTHVVGLAI